MAAVVMSVHAARAEGTQESATSPAPERVVSYGAGATVSLFSTRTSGAPADPMAGGVDMDSTGVGATLRYQTGYPLGGRGVAFTPMVAFETGLGYNSADGEYTGPLWFLLRLEFGLDAGVNVSDDTYVGLRWSFVGHLNASREVGSSDDLWTARVLARYQRTTLAVGIKAPFQGVPYMEGGADDHVTAGLQYQLSRERYVGVEYARFAGIDDGTDYASHEVRLLVGIW